MQKRTLGQNLEVSALGLGWMAYPGTLNGLRMVDEVIPADEENA